MVASLLALALVDAIWVLPAFWAAQFAQGATHPALGGYINDRTDSAVRATILSVAPLGFSLIVMFASPLAGITADRSLGLGFLALAVLVAGGAGFAYALWRRADAGEAPAPAAAEAAS